MPVFKDKRHAFIPFLTMGRLLILSKASPLAALATAGRKPPLASKMDSAILWKSTAVSSTRMVCMTGLVAVFIDASFSCFLVDESPLARESPAVCAVNFRRTAAKSATAPAFRVFAWVTREAAATSKAPAVVDVFTSRIFL
eukprot:9487281-Pyramimonas_sp.AAC.2